jgi:hypothetical protein
LTISGAPPTLSHRGADAQAEFGDFRLQLTSGGSGGFLAGLRHPFGTKHVNANLARLEHCLERIDSNGLTAEDRLTPGQTRSFPAPWVACAEVSR